jgi:hypothetical protein
MLDMWSLKEPGHKVFIQKLKGLYSETEDLNINVLYNPLNN